MKWLHNLSARQRQESTRSIPIHSVFVGKNNSNEIWSVKKKKKKTPPKKIKPGQYRYTETTLGNKSWRIEFFSSAPALNTLDSSFIPRRGMERKTERRLRKRELMKQLPQRNEEWMRENVRAAMKE